MEYLIFSKVGLKGDPYRQPGDIIGGKKTGILEEDIWGIIGRCIIFKSMLKKLTPKKSVLEIIGGEKFKEVKISEENHSMGEKKNLFRFIGVEKMEFPPQGKLPIIRVIPLNLEKRSKKKKAS